MDAKMSESNDLLGPSELSNLNAFVQYAQKGSPVHETTLLDGIDCLGVSGCSYAPMLALASLLRDSTRTWPVLHVQQSYVKAWKALPEEAKAGKASSEAQKLLDHTLGLCKHTYGSLLDLIHSDVSTPVIIDPKNGRTLTHQNLSSIIQQFSLPIQSAPQSKKSVVAISLPNGPLLALTVLAVATYYTAAPVAHGSGVGAEQFKSDVLQSESNMILASASDVDRLHLHDGWIAGNDIQVLLVHLSEDMHLVVTDIDGALPPPQLYSPTPNRADDIGIMLFTSGTSGTKKLVPLRIHSMVCGVAMVIDSWGLSTTMRCLNQMPLNHVGGLIRNLFAPVMSGGSVICCSAFDADLFWDCVEDFAPTWYYASPSMHQGILEAGSERPESISKSRIRLVCNAAGGLLPSLAIRLRDTFSTASSSCTVLPSYGMTECMPISTPPLDYQLDRIGTSGISVGPEIAIVDGDDEHLAAGRVGRIHVRGAPVFGGYLKADDCIDTSCFTESGWFDTGDMGYLDTGGYLYITGRSKEVINRGGELISPFEVEEAVIAAASEPRSPTHGRLNKVLAFSVMHSVLQEVVGLVVVTPEGAQRTCLRDIQDSVKSSLSQVKIPVLLVFMDALPMNNNKVLRIRLAERLDLPEVSDGMAHNLRHYEAVVPAPNTPLSTSIDCTLLEMSHHLLTSACQHLLPPQVDFCLRADSSDCYPELLLSPKAGAETQLLPSSEALIKTLREHLPGYDIPSRIHLLQCPFPRLDDGEVDYTRTDCILHAKSSQFPRTELSKTESAVARIFAQILSLSAAEMSGSSDFFDLGGSSMAAGQLLSKLRKQFQIRLPIDVLFTNRQVAQLATVVDEKTQPVKVESPWDSATSAKEEAPIQLLPGCQETCSSTRPLLMALELLPLTVFYPMKRALTWTIFMYFLTLTQSWFTNDSIPGRLFDLCLSMFAARMITKTVAPLVAIAFKWMVIGKYQEGLYPMWSSYHTKWWICQKVLAVAGMGNFNVSNTTRVLYYRLLGAKIGRNVSIQRGATLGEFDLLTIGDNVVLERCTVRAFAAERNTSMYLGRVSIGSNAVVGTASIVAPGAMVPESTCIGPNSSSWEIDDADENNRNLAASGIPGAHWAMNVFVGIPIQVATKFIGAAPWLLALVALVAHEPRNDIKDMLREVVIWFASPNRVGYHYAALSANAALGPVFFFIAVWVTKKAFDLVCSPLEPTCVFGRSHVTKFRMELFRNLMPAPTFHSLTELFGTHYEMTSKLARMMGAKVGQRVYWPGTGPSIQDFSLLDIGDDVVFGSRSHLVTSDGTGSDHIRIKSGAMVADRVVLLPGVELGEKTVMGSGALTRRNGQYPDGTTWVGSKRGEAVCLSTPVATSTEGSSSASDLPTMTGRTSRTSQYYDQLDRPPQPLYSHPASNSTATTLVRNVDSEASSIAFAERGGFPPMPSENNLSNARDGKVKSATITVRPSSSTGDEDVVDGDATESSSPFGRAFYQGKASYCVWSQPTIFLYSALTIIATAIWWNIGSISAVQIVAYAFKNNTLVSQHFLSQSAARPLALYAYFTALIIAIMAAQSLLVLAFLIAAKWLLMGRRQPGNYDWDKSPYCQRWQLFLKLETLRRHCYGGHGILGLLTGTHWIVMYFRALGLKCGEDCALFAGGLPSLMFTEPDLLTLGDRVSVDDASLVGHINTRGKFDLNPLFVGDRSVLRSGSRLLSGARMEADTCLLEHTLIMAGDVVDEGVTSQGWPAEEFKGNRMPTLKIGQTWVVDKA